MTFCPSCGFNLTRDEIVERDGFHIDPRGIVSFADRVVPVRPADFSILHTVAAACGRPVPVPTLAERLGTDAGDPEGIVRVRLSAMRKAFEQVSAPFPIRNVWGRGYRWEVPA